MARTALTLQDMTPAGLEATYSAANADGHSIKNAKENVFLHVKNGDGSDHTVTIQTPATAAGEPIDERQVVVTAGEERFIGLFDRSVFNQVADGSVYVDFDAVTSVTVAAIRMEKQ